MKKTIIALLIILLITAVSFRLVRFMDASNHQAEREHLEQVYKEATEGKSHPSEAEKVFGKIAIPNLGIDYIILNQTTDDNLDISITKVTGPSIHEKGNLVLAGHYMKNGKFFGKLKNIKKADTIILENSSGTKKEYHMVDQYIVDPTDLSPLSQENQSDSLLTLITCTEDSKKRLIVVAKAD